MRAVHRRRGDVADRVVFHKRLNEMWNGGNPSRMFKETTTTREDVK